MSGSSEDLCARLNGYEQGTHFVKELLFRQCIYSDRLWITTARGLPGIDSTVSD